MSIESLRTAAQYQAERETVFPSASALQWFTRRHREALNKANALLVVNRRLLIVADCFDKVVLEVGLQQLEAAAA